MVTQAQSVDVMLIDMSSTGAKLHGSQLPAEGQAVLVRIGPLTASGTVAWREGGLCGVRFDTPASADEVDKAQRARGPRTLTPLATPTAE